ncbi:uncharacterized protein LOC107479249 [Arachis duranensis]|uniref:Uncharacterized protein LOC107479249 n=1 Tax=Arachis duranensis TaxID=130453 RepID=A0A6P4CUT4_ARADU|nr:uncharacterized protein LOC107479249 [Arachis duranensis]
MGCEGSRVGSSPNVGELRKSILEEAHKSGFSIHPGSTKMYQDLKTIFWWPGIKNDVAMHVSKCRTCQKVKRERFHSGNGRAYLWILYWVYQGLGQVVMLSGCCRSTDQVSSFSAYLDKLYEAGEKSLRGPEMISETTEQIKKIRSRMLEAQSRQKSYADQRQKPLEFEEGEHIFLKVTLTTRIGRSIKTKKLNPR